MLGVVGGEDVDWIEVPTIPRAGALLIMWNEEIIKVTNNFKPQNWISNYS